MESRREVVKFLGRTVEFEGEGELMEGRRFLFLFLWLLRSVR